MSLLKNKLLIFYEINTEKNSDKTTESRDYFLNIILWESGFLATSEILPIYQEHYPLRDETLMSFSSLNELKQFCFILGESLKVKMVHLSNVSDHNRIVEKSTFKDYLPEILKEAIRIPIDDENKGLLSKLGLK